MPLLDFDERPAGVVAGAPNQAVGFARLDAVFFAGCDLWQADGQALGQGIEHSQGVDRFDRFAQTIPCFERRTVHAHAELGRLGLSFVVSVSVSAPRWPSGQVSVRCRPVSARDRVLSRHESCRMTFSGCFNS